MCSCKKGEGNGMRSGTVKMSPNVIFREIAGESILLNLDTETYWGLDKVGTDILKSLLESETFQHAQERLRTEYDIDPNTLHQDIDELVQNLVDAGLLVVEDE